MKAVLEDILDVLLQVADLLEQPGVQQLGRGRVDAVGKLERHVVGLDLDGAVLGVVLGYDVLPVAIGEVAQHGGKLVPGILVFQEGLPVLDVTGEVQHALVQIEL